MSERKSIIIFLLTVKYVSYFNEEKNIFIS